MTESLDGNKNYSIFMSTFLNELSFLIPDFLDIQRLSFTKFLENGLISEFQKRSPIIIRKKKIRILFFSKFYQMLAPKWTPYQSVIRSGSYGSSLYIPIRFKNCFNLLQFQLIY